MAYKISEIELSAPRVPIVLDADQDGFALVARWQGHLAGFHMEPAAPGSTVTAETLGALCNRQFSRRVVAMEVQAALLRRLDDEAPPVPSLTIAICTRNRSARLARLLGSLEPVRRASRFRTTEILVVDNASVDDATRRAAAGFDSVRYVFEPKAGLDFARNTALSHAAGDLIAFLDDDVVVDRDWLAGLFAAWRGCPGAGGFTGLVLPYRLDTEAQIRFEARGGFGRGFTARRFHGASADNPLHPVGSGILGAGCNMAFDRTLLLRLGGFDEALDTGPPLPGGGDLDIFYRVLRAGRTMVYDPRYAVYHEHRETVAQLRRQYWSWGLGFMAYLVKSRRADPDLRAKHGAIVRWWLLDQASRLAKAALRLRGRELGYAAAELWGGVCGLAGEYDRSQARVRLIRERAP